jgi:hypothetical protein
MASAVAGVADSLFYIFHSGKRDWQMTDNRLTMTDDDNGLRAEITQSSTVIVVRHRQPELESQDV